MPRRSSFITLKYQFVEELATGGQSVIWKAKELKTGQIVAIKMMNDTCTDEQFQREANSLKELQDCSHVIRLREVRKVDKALVFDYCPQDLFDWIKMNDVSPKVTRALFRQIVVAVNTMHRRDYAHLDLKLENVLLAEGVVKLADFGFCRKTTDWEMMSKSEGSFSYSAPEVLEQQPFLGKKADIWSLGVILFALSTGKLPWGISDRLNKIKTADYDRRLVSPEVADLLDHMLCVPPEARLSTQDLLQHPFLEE